MGGRCDTALRGILVSEISERFYLFIALAATLFNGAKRFEQFWWRVIQEIFLYNYFKMHPLVKAEKSSEGFSIFSSGGHFVQLSKTV